MDPFRDPGFPTGTVYVGNCLARLADLADNSVDSVVTDPPYGIEFMGKEWDSFRVDDPGTSRHRGERAGSHGGPDKPGGIAAAGTVSYGGGKRPTTNRCQTCGKRDQFRNDHPCGDRAVWVKEIINPHAAPPNSLAFQQWFTLVAAELYRVMKPGGHLLAFGGTRMYHRMTCAIEDAGFEIRDSIHWTYGCLTDDVDVLTPDGWKRGTDIATGDTIAQWNPTDGAITLTPVLDTYRAPWDGPLVRFHNTDTDQWLTPNHRVYHQVRNHRSTGGTAYHEWSEWRVKEAADVGRASNVRLPLAGWHDGPGIGGTDYAALLGWVWTEGHIDGTGTGVRIYQSSVKQSMCDDIAALMDRVGEHKRYDRERTYTRSNGQPHTYTESTWFFTGDLAQRVRADLPGKHPTFDLLWRMSQAEKEAFLAAALAGDGSQTAGGSWAFEQKDPADREWFVSLLALVGRRGHNYTRTARDGGSVSVSQRPETQMTRRALADASVDYSGDVWCVRVATGAFVARRNGQVFITGNSGFPKSLNVGKAIDKAAGAEREVVGRATSWNRPDSKEGDTARMNASPGEYGITAPATDEAAQWEGWGTALKPSHEPIVVARKPLSGTVAANVLEHGTGALNIDGCRVGDEPHTYTPRLTNNSNLNDDGWQNVEGVTVVGRWPANTILTHAAGCADTCVPGCPVAALDTQNDGASRYFTQTTWDPQWDAPFLYVAKPSRKERNAGLDGQRLGGDGTPIKTPVRANTHPTVKPVALMRHLVRLVTPPGGTVLDPFLGSGTTAVAAILEGHPWLGCEMTDEYVPIITGRVEHAQQQVAEAQPKLFG